MSQLIDGPSPDGPPAQACQGQVFGGQVFWGQVALVASAMVLGIQSLRALSPQMSFLLRDRLGWPSAQIGALALLLFCAGFLPFLVGRRLAGPRLTLRRCWIFFAGAMICARLLLQAWQGDPLLDLFAHATVAVAFFGFLPSTLSRVLGDGHRLTAWSVGFFTGQALDLLIFGALGTYDLPWREGFPATLLTTVLTLGLLAALGRRAPRPDAEIRDLGGLVAWAALGPYLFLWFQLFGNPGRFGAWLAQSHSGPWLGALAGCVVLVWAAARPLPSSLPWIAWPVAGALATWVGLAFPPRLPIPAWMITGLGTVTLGLCQLWLLRRLPFGEPVAGPAARLSRLGAAQGMACLALALLTFVHAASFDLPLPFDAARLFPAAALLLGLAMVTVARRPDARTPVSVPRPDGHRSLVLGLAFLALMAVAGTTVKAPTATGGNWPLKIVSYNLHCAVTPRGGFDLEAMARTLEQADGDVVALQEISRGWGTIAGLDMAQWLSRRLDMPYVFYGTGDMTWGNAVLSRLPFESHAGHPLPSPGLLLKRGYIDAHLRLDDGEILRVLATHFHHPHHGGMERELQAEALLDGWGGSPRTVILGDLNAKPPSAEMERFRRADLVDAFEGRPEDEILTFPSGAPIKRIDYIWHSPDLEHDASHVSPSTASDHRLIETVLRVRDPAPDTGSP